MMYDTASLAVMLQSIGQPHQRGGKEVRVRYYSNLEESAPNGETLVCEWSMSIECVSLGECFINEGMLTAHFTENKLARLDMVFDVMAFMQHLRRVCYGDGCQAIPSAIDVALQPSDQARVITEAYPPFHIVHVNDAWSQLCGFTADDVLGKTLKIIQGPETKGAALAKMMKDVAAERPSSAVLVNYTQNGSPFTNFLQVFPLWCEEGSAVAFMGILEKIEPQ